MLMNKISIALQVCRQPSVSVSWKSCSFFLLACVFRVFFFQKYSKYSPFPPPTHPSYNHFIFQTDFNFPLYTEA